MRRDPKGLYAKVRRGMTKNFTGVDAPYEAPEASEVWLRTLNTRAEDLSEHVIEALIERRRIAFGQGLVKRCEKRAVGPCSACPDVDGVVMDTSPPDPGVNDLLSKQSSHAASSSRAIEYCAAVAIAALAIVTSPIAIRLLTGRVELSFRLTLLSVILDLFLLFLASALIASGRARRIFFHLLALSLPFVLLAVLEILAAAVHLADRIALLDDLSVIKRGNNWGSSMSHQVPSPADGFLLYKPWHGNGVTINDLGLRTALPGPKSPGERRIAVTGGSVTWGFGLADADTIPAMLHASLRHNGHDEFSAYNFGIEGATIARELALLKHFREIYGIDQVVFLTGGNDLFSEYFAMDGQPLGATPKGQRVTAFELYKSIERIRISWFTPSATQVARLDELYASRIKERSPLIEGIVSASNYCRDAGLRCDFVLQPHLITRQSPVGTEVEMTKSAKSLYPRLRSADFGDV